MDFLSILIYSSNFAFTDVPSPPGQPKADIINKDSCKITWSPPESDNGAPVTGYVIEKYELISGEWIKVKEEKVKEEEVRVLFLFF